MIGFYLDTDDDFEVGHGLDISAEIIEWESHRAADRISRFETEGALTVTARRGRASLDWWRVGRLIEARLDDVVFFRGFIRDAVAAGDGKTTVRAFTWLQYMRWRGLSPDLVDAGVLEGVRRVVNAAADGFPGAIHPSARLIEQIFGVTRPRRLYWRLSDAPLFWRSADKPLYWRIGPAPEPDAYHYGRVGDTDVVGDTTLAGPPQPAVVGESQAVVDYFTAVVYRIVNEEYGFYEDELAALAAGELGWIFSGGANDIDCVGRSNSVSPAEAALQVTSSVYGRYGYLWDVGTEAVGQIVGRAPELLTERRELASADGWRVAPGYDAISVPVGRRAGDTTVELEGGYVAEWSPRVTGVSVGASASDGVILVEFFNDTGAGVEIDWRVMGVVREHIGTLHDVRVTGRFGGQSVDLLGAFGGAAGLTASLDYWARVLGPGGVELSSVTLDGWRFDSAWSGQIGGLLEADALEREGLSGGPTRYWIIGVRGRGSPSAVEVTYDLMRYVGVA